MMKLICPMHDDGAPSLCIYDDGHVHCFGCGYHASLFDLLLYLVGWRSAVTMLSAKTWFSFLEQIGGKRSNGAFNPGEQIPWDTSHPAMRGVKVSVQTLADYGCSLHERALKLVFDVETLEGLDRSWQYRLGPGKYLHRPGYAMVDKLGALGPMSTYAVVVEGVLDGLRLVELGYRGRVLVLTGSAITSPRIDLLNRYERLLLALDPDEAGRKAAEGIKSGVSAKVETLFLTCDPQDLEQLPGEVIAFEQRS